MITRYAVRVENRFRIIITCIWIGGDESDDFQSILLYEENKPQGRRGGGVRDTEDIIWVQRLLTRSIFVIRLEMTDLLVTIVVTWTRLRIASVLCTAVIKVKSPTWLFAVLYCIHILRRVCPSPFRSSIVPREFYNIPSQNTHSIHFILFVTILQHG